jgi:hypothetical protein
MMRKLILLLAVLALLIIPITVAYADRPVEYTWTLAALGQGGWIGGPLFEDGSVGGGGAFSSDNGQIIASFEPTSWTEDADDNITVCFNVTIRKGPADALPSTICTPPAPETGTPVKMIIFGSEHIFRISEELGHHEEE